MPDVEEIVVQTDSVSEVTLTTSVTQMTAEIDTGVGGPGAKGAKGDQGLPGTGVTVGGYNVAVDSPQEADVLYFSGGQWINEPSEDLVDGGNF